MKKIDGVFFSSLGLKFMDYAHPLEVVQDDRLSYEEKRNILCSWACDACAVESRPGFRWLPGTPGPILVDHILAALACLDDFADGPQDEPYGAMMARATFGPAARRGGGDLHIS